MNEAYPPIQYQQPKNHAEAINDRRVEAGKRPLKQFKVNPMETHKIIMKQPGAVHVNACEHRTDPRSEPRFANCQHCWNVYFQFNPGITQATAALAEAFGQPAVKDQKGKKFYRAFVAFIESRMREAASKFESHT